MELRPIDVRDADVLAELEIELFDNCLNEHTLRKEIQAGWGFVAVEDDKVIGYALLRTDKQTTEQRKLSDLLRLGVAKSHQAKGLGTRLLEACLPQAGDCMLFVRKDNEGARRLYARYGFTVVGCTQESWVMRRASPDCRQR